MSVPQFSDRANCLTLAAMPSAVSIARAYVDRSLYAKKAHPDALANAAIVTSELVTNAVNAVGIKEINPNWAKIWDQIKPIAVCAYVQQGLAVIEVWDDDPNPPKRREAMDTDEDGRGLLLVEALCKAWGYRWPTTGGKVVWCAL